MRNLPYLPEASTPPPRNRFACAASADLESKSFSCFIWMPAASASSLTHASSEEDVRSVRPIPGCAQRRRTAEEWTSRQHKTGRRPRKRKRATACIISGVAAAGTARYSATLRHWSPRPHRIPVTVVVLHVRPCTCPCCGTRPCTCPCCGL